MIIEVAIENIDGDDDGNRLKCDLPNADIHYPKTESEFKNPQKKWPIELISPKTLDVIGPTGALLINIISSTSGIIMEPMIFKNPTMKFPYSTNIASKMTKK